MINMFDSLNLIYDGVIVKNKTNSPKTTAVTERAIERRELILKIVKDKFMYGKEIALIMNISLDQARRDIGHMVKKGALINASAGTNRPLYVKVS